MKLLRYGLAVTSVAAIAFSVSTTQVAAGSGMESKTTLINFADLSPVEGSEGTLMRMENGVSVKIETVGLTAGDAVTMWWVVFNAPENCSDGECDENDVFLLDADGGFFILNDDGSPPFNGPGIEAAEISVNYADGHVIDEGGAATFLGQLPVGDTSRTLLGPGLTDPMGAVIHLVLRSHGKAIPGQIDAMTQSINGGCADAFPNPPCKDPQFAAFMPPES